MQSFVRYDGATCVYRTTPAFGRGLAAAASLLTGQVVLSAAAGSCDLLVNGDHHHIHSTTIPSCLDSGGGLGLYLDELCATTTSNGVHGQGLSPDPESFVFGGFQQLLEEDHHKALLLAAGAANQLDQQYSAAASSFYDEAKPLVSLTGGGNGAGGTSTGSSFFYDSSYSNNES